MIKFFRKIRYKLMSENKTSKYFKYAIGEIILVVIGILIALQINNWNEEKANEIRVRNTLRQIQADLLNDIQELVQISNFYDNNLILIEQFLDGIKPKTYFENNFRPLAQATLSYSPFSQSNQAFLRLKNQLDQLPEKYNPLLKNLSRLYVENGTILSFSHDITLSEMIKYKSKLYDNYDWIEDYNNRNYTKEIKDFFLNSKINRRQLVKTKSIFSEHGKTIGFIKDQSISCYFMIRDVLEDDSELPDIFNQFGLKYKKNNIDDFLGTYQHSKFSSLQNVITVRNNILRLTNPNNQSVNIESSILQEIGKDTLATMLSQRSYMVIKRDKSQDVVGISIILKSNKKEVAFFNKIKQ